MSAPFRIARHKNEIRLGGGEPAPDPMKAYVDRLLRLIPGEIVALYLAGRAAIIGYFTETSAKLSQSRTWIVWSAICVVLLFLIRTVGTRDKRIEVPPEWGAVIVAVISFLVWVYSFGDVFQIALGLWNPLIATLSILVWTVAAPLIYNPKS